MKIDKDAALKILKKNKSVFETVFAHGTLSLEIYKPDKVDLQQPHDRDEVYIIISGTGDFLNGEERVSFKAGDFLFVPALREHRFENFSDDFATWVLFYGPQGGEIE
ncbi:MAG: cupin domain-containing protein [Flavobacteriaceae bacterium]